MRIVVCLKDVVDAGIDLGYGRIDPVLMKKGFSRRLDPDCLEALVKALAVKASVARTEIVLLTVGPPEAEKYLREGLASGADRAVRIWEKEFIELSPYQKAKVLKGAVSLLEADIILTGAQSLDNGSGLVGSLTAAFLGWPFISDVIALQTAPDQKSLTVTRNVERGLKEKLEAAAPLVMSVKSGGGRLPYASLDQLLESREEAVEHLSLADTGLSYPELKNDSTLCAGLSFPRPATRPAPLDSSLPAFYRILALLEGGMSKRRSEIFTGSREDQVDQLYDLMVKEKILKSSLQQ
jgi:electron transfer flavoprotein beta subunit